jgi:hypothetical protein
MNDLNSIMNYNLKTMKPTYVGIWGDVDGLRGIDRLCAEYLCAMSRMQI